MALHFDRFDWCYFSLCVILERLLPWSHSFEHIFTWKFLKVHSLVINVLEVEAKAYQCYHAINEPRWDLNSIERLWFFVSEVGHPMSIMVPNAHWYAWFCESMLVSVSPHESLLLEVFCRAWRKVLTIEVKPCLKIVFFMFLFLFFWLGSTFTFEVWIILCFFILLVVLVSPCFDVWI